MINALPPHTVEGDGRHREIFLRMTQRLREINRDYFPYDRARKLYADDRLPEAEDALREAIAGNPEQAPFYNLYGLIRLKENRYAEAGRQFDTALSYDPGFQPALFGRGAASYLRGDYRRALHDFEESLGLYPGHLGSTLGAGASNFQLQRYREAIPHLRDVAEAAPGHPEVHGMLGVCYEAVGDIRSAYNEYAAQVQVAPDNDFGRHARQRLLVIAPMLDLPVR
jgi:tetratricopeptide (TPR) repeat protein